MPEMFENKAKFAANSRAIRKNFNAVIGHLRYEMRVYDSIRASLRNGPPIRDGGPFPLHPDV